MIAPLLVCVYACVCVCCEQQRKNTVIGLERLRQSVSLNKQTHCSQRLTDSCLCACVWSMCEHTSACMNDAWDSVRNKHFRFSSKLHMLHFPTLSLLFEMLFIEVKHVLAQTLRGHRQANAGRKCQSPQRHHHYMEECHHSVEKVHHRGEKHQHQV